MSSLGSSAAKIHYRVNSKKEKELIKTDMENSHFTLNMARAEKLSALAKRCTRAKTSSMPGPSFCHRRCVFALPVSEHAQTTAVQSSPWLPPLCSPAKPSAGCEIPSGDGEHRAIPCIFLRRFLCPGCFLIQEMSCYSTGKEITWITWQ